MITIDKAYEDQTLIEKLRNRAAIRRQISNRKSVQEGRPDRLADLLEEAAEEIERLQFSDTNANGEQTAS